MTFQLHPRLQADTFFVTDLPLSRILLMNDARYHWLILVPRLEDARELHQLPESVQLQLCKESAQVAKLIEQLFIPDKMNVAVLGNIVPQLHVHHIARFKDDPAWPGPVWGHSPAQAYTEKQVEEHLKMLRQAL